MIIIGTDGVVRSQTEPHGLALPARGHIECSLERVEEVCGKNIGGADGALFEVWTPAGPLVLREVGVGVADGTLRWRIEAFVYEASFWLCKLLLGSTAAAVTAAFDGETGATRDALVDAFCDYLKGCWTRLEWEDEADWLARTAEYALMYAEVGGVLSAARFGGPTTAEASGLAGRWAKLPHGCVRQRALGLLRGLVRWRPRSKPQPRVYGDSVYEALMQLLGLRAKHFAWFAFRHPGAPLEAYRDYVETLRALAAARRPARS